LQDPETAREFALQEIQKETIKDGLSGAEHTGALIEAITFGSAGRVPYVNGLLETPSANVQQLRKELASIDKQVANMREKSGTVKVDPHATIANLNTFEEQVFRIEQLIKLYSIESAVLISDANALNEIEGDIFNSKRLISDARLSAGFGTIQEPTDAQVFFALNELKGGR